MNADKDIFDAIYENDIHKLMELINDENLDINQIDNVSGFTPLTYAIYLDRPEIVRLLLRVQDIDVNLADQGQYNDTPLSLAISKDNIEIIKILLERPDIQLNVINQDGYNELLYHALYLNKLLPFRLLLNAGAVDVGDTIYDSLIRENYFDNSGEVNYYIYLLSLGDQRKMENLNLVVKDISEFTIISAYAGDIDALRYAKENLPVEFNTIRDSDGNTLLSIVANHDDLELNKFVFETVKEEFQDYNKSIGTKQLIRYLIRENRNHMIPVTIAFKKCNIQVFNYLYKLFSPAMQIKIWKEYLSKIRPCERLRSFYAEFLERTINPEFLKTRASSSGAASRDARSPSRGSSERSVRSPSRAGSSRDARSPRRLRAQSPSRYTKYPERKY